MPVASVSRRWMPWRYSLPERERPRSSSSSASTPSAMTLPLASSAGASGFRVCWMRSRMGTQGSSRWANSLSASASAEALRRFSTSTCSRARPTCSSSRGFTLANDTFEIRRSRSLMVRMASWKGAMVSRCSTKCATTLYRSVICSLFFRGRAIQRRISRLPMGETVRSMMSISVLAFVL